MLGPPNRGKILLAKSAKSREATNASGSKEENPYGVYKPNPKVNRILVKEIEKTEVLQKQHNLLQWNYQLEKKVNGNKLKMRKSLSFT